MGYESRQNNNTNNCTTATICLQIYQSSCHLSFSPDLLPLFYTSLAFPLNLFSHTSIPHAAPLLVAPLADCTNLGADSINAHALPALNSTCT